MTQAAGADGTCPEINSREQREKRIVDFSLIFRDNNLAQRHSSRYDSHAQLLHLIRHYISSLRGTSSPLRASFRVSTPYLKRRRRFSRRPTVASSLDQVIHHTDSPS
jgi:hypothetical protein